LEKRNGIGGKQPIFLAGFFKMAGEGLGIILLLRDTAASRPSKNVPVFWKLYCSTLKQKALPARRAGTKQGGQSVLNGIFLSDRRPYYQTAHLF
jgi:hypothetical protein